MFRSIQQSSTRIRGNDASNDDSSEAERIFTDLRSLRRNVIDAWQARGVILTAEERRELRDEIRETCALLEDLTGGCRSSERWLEA